MPEDCSIFRFRGPLADRESVDDLTRDCPSTVAWSDRRMRRLLRRCSISSCFSTPRAWMNRLLDSHSKLVYKAFPILPNGHSTGTANFAAGQLACWTWELEDREGTLIGSYFRVAGYSTGTEN
jgi:hypothetical protein